MPNEPYDIHVPVLLQEVLGCLDPKSGQSYLDLTAGYGGHFAAILERTAAPDKAVLVDRDDNAVQALRKRFGDKTDIRHIEFLSALEQLASEGRRFDMILADLGVSSPHIEDSGRGFSFKQAGPLDMRMDRRQEVSAADLVNGASHEELKRILTQYGEEPHAARIAAAIIAARPINDTAELAAIIARAAGFKARHGKIHPATKSFQAIRIAVNQELDQLQRGLPLMLDLLSPGGRLAIISFHSLEDRIVKQFLAEHSGKGYDAEMELLTKKPISASHEEIVSNPRARSAKLRASRKK
jgi:16S rRNA (cytosine1402-N4)-methyltransferase